MRIRYARSGIFQTYLRAYFSFETGYAYSKDTDQTKEYRFEAHPKIPPRERLSTGSGAGADR